jgi:hypothetical protein
MRLKDCKKELHSLLKQEKLIGATLLIFCNKQVALSNYYLNKCKFIGYRRSVDRELNKRLLRTR